MNDAHFRFLPVAKRRLIRSSSVAQEIFSPSNRKLQSLPLIICICICICICEPSEKVILARLTWPGHHRTRGNILMWRKWARGDCHLCKCFLGRNIFIFSVSCADVSPQYLSFLIRQDYKKFSKLKIVIEQSGDT